METGDKNFSATVRNDCQSSIKPIQGQQGSRAGGEVCTGRRSRYFFLLTAPNCGDHPEIEMFRISQAGRIFPLLPLFPFLFFPALF